MKKNAELEPFVRLIEALEPWLGQVVVIGGWAHRLYRLDPRAQGLTYPPLTTLDTDIAVPSKIEIKETSIRDRLLAAGFHEAFVGEDRPPATHYHLGGQGGFYAEFLTPLVGSEHGRKEERKATREIGGISSQQLRYIEILLLAPWRIPLDKTNGYPFVSTKQVQVANPVSFLTQKILIQHARDRKDRAKDILYIHDTIETFAGNLAELRELFADEIRPKLHEKKAREVSNAADALFGDTDDTIREAVQMVVGRKLSPEALTETCRAGLKAIFE
ncbi:MAG: GSU2403 family nucleotidyltransferase fold protein [Acidobacteriota bacterium]